MKTTYVHFGTKGYHYDGADASADQFVGGDAATALVLANAGMVPQAHTADIANTSTSTDFYNVIIRAAAGTTGDRGAAYTHDFYTGAAFTAAANPAAGDITRLNAAGWGVGSSGDVGKITIVESGGTAFYDIQNNDEIWVEQIASSHAVLANGSDGSVTGGKIVCGMDKYLGADPVALAWKHYDGTDLDQTNLFFDKRVGDGTNLTIKLIHKAGKFPQIVKTMEMLANCGIYDKAVTFFDNKTDGTIISLDESMSNNNSLGIVGCFGFSG